MVIHPMVQVHLTHSSAAPKDHVSEGSGVPLKPKTADRRHPIHTQVHPIANRDPMAIPQTVQAHLTHSSLAPKDHVGGDSGVPLKPKPADRWHPVHIQAHQTTNRDPTDTQTHPANNATNKGLVITRAHQTLSKATSNHKRHVDKDKTAPPVLRTPALEELAITFPTCKTLAKDQAVAIQTRSSAALKVPVAIRLVTPTLRVTRALTDLILLQATLADKRGTLAASLEPFLEPVCTLVVMASGSQVSTAFDFI